MKRWISALLLSVFLVGCGAQTGGEGYRQMDMDSAAELMEEETGYILLDVRTQEEFAQEHIPGAICIPNETIGEAVRETLEDPEQLILVYCRSGNRSRQAAGKLSDLGYTNIVEIGGIQNWSGETVSGTL